MSDHTRIVTGLNHFANSGIELSTGLDHFANSGICPSEAKPKPGSARS